MLRNIISSPSRLVAAVLGLLLMALSVVFLGGVVRGAAFGAGVGIMIGIMAKARSQAATSGAERT
ncbi:hypothetical protein GA0115245_129219 [Streptomyces sp. di188]|nr:hypothetical protein GA0115238_101815 [Streptomyces sp. di50b]SCE29328.1 hypothetical protein GA0115245_129219 [Streptomyces sp. di188]